MSTGKHPAYARAEELTARPAGHTAKPSGDVDEDEAAFMRELGTLPEADRPAALRLHLQQQGASEAAMRTGALRLASGGLDALTTWLNGDLQRDLAQVRENAATARGAAHEDAETAREQVRQLGLTDRARLAAENPPAENPPASSVAGGKGALIAGAVVVGLGLVAALAMAMRAGKRADS